MNSPTKVLKVFHFGETEEENKVITLSPVSIRMVVADPLPTIRQGKPTKRTVIVFDEGGGDEMFISDYDLESIEAVVGTYSMDF